MSAAYELGKLAFWGRKITGSVADVRAALNATQVTNHQPPFEYGQKVGKNGPKSKAKRVAAGKTPGPVQSGGPGDSGCDPGKGCSR